MLTAFAKNTTGQVVVGKYEEIDMSLIRMV